MIWKNLMATRIIYYQRESILHFQQENRHSWENGYCCRKWTCLPEFKSRIKLFAFHLHLYSWERHESNYYSSSYGSIVGQTENSESKPVVDLERDRLQVIPTQDTWHELGRYDQTRLCDQWRSRYIYISYVTF